jgi:hypothetical protein
MLVDDLQNIFKEAIAATKTMQPYQHAEHLHQVIVGPALSDPVAAAKGYAQTLMNENLVNDTVQVIKNSTIERTDVPRGQNGINQLVAQARNGTLIVDLDRTDENYVRSLQAHLTKAVHTDRESPVIVLAGREDRVEKFLESARELTIRMPKTRVHTKRGPAL